MKMKTKCGLLLLYFLITIPAFLFVAASTTGGLSVWWGFLAACMAYHVPQSIRNYTFDWEEDRIR